MTTYRVFNRPILNNTFLGYDRLLDMMDTALSNAKIASFPPYDIFKEGDSVVLQMALAGMKKHQIKVDFDPKDRVLTVSGDTARTIQVEDTPSSETSVVVADKDVVHKGISTRKFTRQFTVGPDHEVGDVTYADGLLTISLVKNDPEPVQLISYDIK